MEASGVGLRCRWDGYADWLVRNGLALDWPKYSKGGYADAQG